MSDAERSIRRFVGECLRKKRLRAEWADKIVAKAKAEGTTLRSYYCPHCTHYHVSKMPAAAHIPPRHPKGKR